MGAGRTFSLVLTSVCLLFLILPCISWPGWRAMSYVNIDAEDFGEARLYLYGLSYRLPGETAWITSKAHLGVGPNDLPGPISRGLRGAYGLSRALGVLHPLTTALLALSFALAVYGSVLAWALGAVFYILSVIFVFCCMIIDDALVKTVRKSADVLYIGALTGHGTAGWLMVPPFLLLVLVVIPLHCGGGPRTKRSADSRRRTDLENGQPAFPMTGLPTYKAVTAQTSAV